MSSSSAAQAYIELIPVYNAGFIVLAYIIAVVGAWTTIELLLRRTGGAGYWNGLLLVAAGVAFGSTATFGMHFIGNQSVRLTYPTFADGRTAPDPVRLSYDIGYTLLSLVVACLSMIIAFSLVGLRVTPRSWSWLRRAPKAQDSESGSDSELPLSESEDAYKETKTDLETEEDDDGGDFGLHPAKVSTVGVLTILGAGFLCGGGIAAMHYVGQVSINSVPRVTNTGWIVFLSVLIAILAVSLGLYLLFVILRPKLDHRWYKRLGVAMILGFGTSLMHFVALLGTHYFTMEGDGAPASGATSKRLIIALVATVGPVCCISLLAIAIIGQAQVVRNMAQRQRIIVAVALFDQQGLMLVQPDGLLPSAEIAALSKGPKEDDDDAGKSGESSSAFARFWAPFFRKNRLSLEAMSQKLTKDDPAFIAFLRTSWSWRSWRPQSTGYRPSTSMSILSNRSFTPKGPSGNSYGRKPGLHLPEDNLNQAISTFEQAALDLSNRLSGSRQEPKVTGVLYDGILKTGHFTVSSKTSGDNFTVTQGQMLVLTRRIKSATERDSFLERGFTFAEPQDAAKITADTLVVPQARVFDFFKDVYRFSRFGVVRRIEPAKIYVGILIVQALPRSGIRLVVDNKMHHSIPIAELGSFSAHAPMRDSLVSAPLNPDLVDSVARGTQDLAGQSLAELVEAQHHLHHSHNATLLRSQIVTSLMPLLHRTLSPELRAHIYQRLIVTPTLIPLLNQTHSALAPESYLVCLKVIVPAAVELPGRPNWLSYALYKAQNECVNREAGRELAKLVAAARLLPSSPGHVAWRQPAPDAVEPRSQFERDLPPTGSINPQFLVTEAVTIPPYSADWVLTALKASAPPSPMPDYSRSQSRDTEDDEDK
ncbi:hypothetical protein P7C70_g3315, partial [Phenoliferia sp. Uapishka_3]